MDRPVPKPDLVRAEPPGLEPADAPPEAPPPPARPRIGTAGRVVIFLWLSAFGFLAAYELLYALFKLLKIRE